MKPSAWRGIAALVLGATLVLAAAPKALAQQPSEAPSPTPPKGPRDVITGARQAREARELERAVAPSAADPHAAAGPTADPHAAGPGRAPPVSRANANPELPVGTIRVRVLDHQGKPVPGAPVSLGIMKSDSSRDKQDATAGPDGEVTFSDLYVGDRQAYRVNVPYQGAKYSSTPFRLPPRGGYDVEIRRLPVTRDDRWIVMYVGATSIELKDERIKVVQQARLVNIGNATYVFPDEGTLVTLPEGFTAVQTQDVMTDQHIEEVPGKGLAFRGSLTPGEATLLWGFDLPLSGSEVSFSIGIPWAAFAYRVVADAAPGLQVDIDGMPAPSLHTDDGRRFWVSEVQRRVGETPFRTLSVKLRGIPGPGPARWIAALLALVAVGAGVVLGGRPASPSPTGSSDAASTTEARRADLLARARSLRVQREAGEIGPEYEAEQLAFLTDELAALLLQAGRAAAAKG